jgi:hypothetical protein
MMTVMLKDTCQGSVLLEQQTSVVTIKHDISGWWKHWVKMGNIMKYY